MMRDMLFHEDDKPREACGLFGLMGAQGETDAAHHTYHALFALQHRGQTSAGIAVSNGSRIRHIKGNGLVPEVFTGNSLESLSGHIALGHVRYATHSESTDINAQPIVAEVQGRQIALAFNGNITNSDMLRIELENHGGILQTTGDAEIILHIVVREMMKSRSLERAVQSAMKTLAGAYSIIIITPEKMVAARDPQGFRPLCYGKRGDKTIITSESCALDAVDADFVRDIAPGEVFVADKSGIQSYQAADASRKALCVFEFVYFARPDSTIDGVSVELARQASGEALAMGDTVEADVVIGVPDSGLSAALGYARASGIPYSVGFVKNRYIGRTFIQSTQGERVKSLRIKLNALSAVVRGKRVVMVDDSIVRGSTLGRIVSNLREAGATEVHMRVSSPPYLHPCYFGTDIPNREHLFANERSESELAEYIGVDSLRYLRLEDLNATLKDLRTEFCDACFTGKYPIPVSADQYKGNAK